MIVLDTNVLSELMRGEPHPSVVAWLNRQADTTLFLTALTLAELRAAARRQGLAISDADALIAATVRAHRFQIATRDVAPFEMAGVRVINPFAD